MGSNHHPNDHANSGVRPPQTVADDLRSLQLGDAERRPPGGGGRGRLFLLLVSLPLLGGAGYGLWSWFPHWQSVEEVEAIVFSPRANTDTLLDVTGYIIPHKRINITPEVSGIILRVPIEEGMKVKKGDLLIQIDDWRLKADYEQAQAALAVAQAQYDELKAGSRPEEVEQARASRDQAQAHRAFLKGEVERGVAARPGVGVSVSDHDHNVRSYQEAEATLRSQTSNLRLIEKGPREEKIRAAKGELDRQAAAVSKAKFYYERTRILAPCDATVLERKAEVGEAVHPEVSVNYLCVLANLSDLEAEVDVQERDLALLKQAQECQVLPDAYPDKVYRGRFDRLQPQVNRQRGIVKVKVTILDPDEALLADMNCRALFVRGKRDSADAELPTVPERARVKEGNDWVVYTFDNLAARRRVIECGRTVGNAVQVRSGLKGGEVVLIPGKNALFDDKVVRPRVTEPGPSPRRKDE
jgi:multidrug efflux pump subunit AcrA (membrane-fusion protein)